MISIIIPVYNHGKYLGKCLDSILYQTNKDIEIILVNDGSKDSSLEVSESYKGKFEKEKITYKIISYEENKGAPYVRNQGFQIARGHYVLFCDADSVLEKNMLLEMLNTLNSHPEASFVYSSFWWGEKLFKLYPFCYKKLKKMPYIHTMSLLRTKDFPAAGWDENIKKLQDWDLWLTICEKEKTGIWINKPLFKIHTGGTMSSWLPSFAYKLFPFLPSVKKYNHAVKIIREKHHLN